MKFKWTTTIKSIDIRDERGSSSVLVIMIMLLLISFGVLTMMSSYSNLKMARKNAEWTKDFYALESLAQKSVAEFSAIFKQANGEYDAAKSSNIENQDVKSSEMMLLKLFDLCQQNEVINPQIESCNFKSQDEILLSSETYIPTLQLTIQDQRTNRQFSCIIQMDKNHGYSIIEWREIPVVFEEEGELNFQDPEGL